MHHDYLTLVTFNDKSQTRNGKSLIANFEIADVGCEMCDERLWILPCALNLAPYALLLLTPET